MSESAIFKLYRSLDLWTNPVCRQCRSDAAPELSGPIGVWQVGRKYESDAYRLLLIGKNARGTIFGNVDEQLEEQGFIDGTGFADESIYKKRWAFWHYQTSIIERLFGSIDEGWERVACTNLIKCNNSMGIDTTSFETAKHCLDQLGVVWKEIDILKPLTIILFTGAKYDNFILNYTSKFEYADKTDRIHRVTNGLETILWWERHCRDETGRTFRVLRTSHLERQMKAPFVERLARWIGEKEH